MAEQENRLISLFLEIAPSLYELITTMLGGDRCVFTVTNREHFVYSDYGAGLDLGVRVGNIVKQGTGAYTCMDLRKLVRIEVDSSVMGLPYVVNSQPLFEKGQVIGSINVATSLLKRDTLVKSAENMETFSHIVFDMIHNISEKTDALRSLGHEMATEAVASKERLKDTTQFIAGIKTVAYQTNLLGINAAIEAARTRQAGFGVVAEEIRHLSNDTKKFVDQIQPFLENIQNSSAAIEEKNNLMNTHSEDLSTASDEVLKFLDDMKQMVAELKALSAKL